MTDFEAFYTAFKDLVFNLSLNYVQNREDAEEITQDVFISAHDKFSEFRQESKLSTWLYRITINRCIDFERAKKRQKRFAFISSLFGNNNALIFDPPSFDHPGVQLEDKETMKKIFEAINSLPDKQKTALILLKIEGKSQAETAEVMQTSIKAVESLFQRAKNNLSKKLKNNEGFE
jgi:RNA polymerase sigma-70 factor (ECF subfamily)